MVADREAFATREATFRAEAQRRLEELEAKYKAQLAKLNAEMAKRDAEWIGVVNRLKEEMDQKASSYAELELRYNLLDKENARLRVQVDALDQRVADMNQVLREVREKIDAAKPESEHPNKATGTEKQAPSALPVPTSMSVPGNNGATWPWKVARAAMFVIAVGAAALGFPIPHYGLPF